MTDLQFEIVIMSELRSRVNSLHIDFNRVRENRNEYRERAKIYKSQMIDLRIDKKKLEKKIQKLLRKQSAQTSRFERYYMNDFDVEQFRTRILRRNESDQSEY